MTTTEVNIKVKTCLKKNLKVEVEPTDRDSTLFHFIFIILFYLLCLLPTLLSKNVVQFSFEILQKRKHQREFVQNCLLLLFNVYYQGKNEISTLKLMRGSLPTEQLEFTTFSAKHSVTSTLEL